jgi:hypothetical protein
MEGDIPVTGIPHRIDQMFALIDTRHLTTDRSIEAVVVMGITATITATVIVVPGCISRAEILVSDFDTNSLKTHSILY